MDPKLIPIGDWTRPLSCERNNFVNKALSSWAANVAVGCGHACDFCYVPEVSTIRLGAKLKPLGVSDPDAEWGEYVFVRAWDRTHWRNTIAKAERTPVEKLNADGNRAVMFCTTTDPYQIIRHPEHARRAELQGRLNDMMTEALADLCDLTTLNVRIVGRLHGVHHASKSTKADWQCPAKLPFMFGSWAEYRDYLVDHLVTNGAAKAEFKRRILHQNKTYEADFPDQGIFVRAQISCVLCNDYEMIKFKNWSNGPAINTWRKWKAGITSPHTAANPFCKPAK